MNHLDLFSGIGGFSLGLKKAGIEPDWIGFSDIDKYANEVFKRRFPNAEQLNSITTIQPDKLPKIDLITFGFPCQDLSIAGKRGGLTANRSSLFFEAIKIIQHKKPKYFIFENVKGIFSSNGGKDFDIILRSIADIGYDGQWELCNTRWYLPQNRERIYFVGHIRGECRPKVFPLGESNKEIKKVQGQYTNTLKSRYEAIGDGSYIIESKLNAQERKIEIVGHSGSGGERGDIHSVNGVMSCLTATDYKQPKQIATEEGCRGIRKLSPTECERLQGFADGWTDHQSDTQRYKQLGNAVSVPVVKAIMKRLYKRR